MSAATRLLLSGLYVGPNFLASILIVALLARDASVDARAAFFVFLALYSPLTTVMSQTTMIMAFRQVARGRSIWLQDGVGFAASLALAYAALGHALALWEVSLLAASIISSYHAFSDLGRVQIARARSGLWASIPVSIALVRMGVAWLAEPAGVAVAFAVSSFTFLALTKAILATLTTDVPEPPADSAQPSSHTFWTLIFFFVASSVLFQWDKLVWQGYGDIAIVAAAGATTTLVLSPLSVIFASAYRADAAALFSKARPATRAQIRNVLLSFLVAAAIYIVLICLLWQAINHLLFPFNHLSPTHAVILCTAVTIDRVLSLFTFASNRNSLYVVAGATRLCAVAIGSVVFTYTRQSPDVMAVYIYLLAASILSLFTVLLWRRKFEYGFA